MISIFIYPKSATASDLLTNGYGRIACTKCDVSEDINADFYAEIEIPRGSVNEEYVIGGAILKIPCHRGFQYFRIGLPEQNLSMIKAKAWHISYDLAADMIINSWWDAKTAQEALTGILHAGLTETRFSGTTDITSSANLRAVRSSVLSTLIDTGRDNSFVKIWGGEAYRDNFTFDMRSSLGSDSGVRIAYKKNLTGLDIKEDWTQIATRIVPTCLSASDGVLSLPETFIDSAKINDYPYPYVRTIHYSDIKVGQETDGVVLYPDEAAAYAELRARVAALYAVGADVPKTTATVTFAELSKTREYAQYSALESVGLGDTVTAVYRTVALKNRVRGIKFDALTQKITSVTLGDPSRNTLLTTMYAHDVDLSALKSEVTQTVKQGEAYNNVYICHDEGFVSTATVGGREVKTTNNATDGIKITVDNVPVFWVTPGGRVMAKTIGNSDSYYAEIGSLSGGGIGLDIFDGGVAFVSIVRTNGFAFYDGAGEHPRAEFLEDGSYLLWDSNNHLCAWVKNDGTNILYGPSGSWMESNAAGCAMYSANGANSVYVTNAGCFAKTGGTVHTL